MISEIEKVILVPCDFSSLGFYALEHGTFMSKIMNSRLVMLHVVAHESEIAAMRKKMEFIVEDWFEKFAIRPEILIRCGIQPYSVIKDVANELEPIFVILKTGGGTKTIEILSGTSIPFIVIQDEPKSETMTNIALPINFMLKLDEKMKRVIHFADYYPEAMMHIITPSGKGTTKERNVSTAINLTRKVLNDQNIKVNYITHNGKKNTAETILEHCIDCNMIVVQIEDSTWLSRLLFGMREEKLIKNEHKIPVFCFRKESAFV